MCHSRRAIGPTTRRVLRCAAPAPEALTDVTGEDSRAGSKAVLPCDLLRLVASMADTAVNQLSGTVVYTRTWGLVVAVGCQRTGTGPRGARFRGVLSPAKVSIGH